MTSTRSAHVDSFARESLPRRDSWPQIEHDLPELQYPERLNAAVVLLDKTIDSHGPERVALRTPEGDTWTYGELLARVNQISRVLAEDYAIVPGNRVLLRIPNNPWAVACWFAVLKVGAIAVTTMVAWKSTEITKVALKTKPDLVIVDHRFSDDLAGSIDESMRILFVGGDGPNDLVAVSATKPTDFDAVDTAADDVAILAPTSGTTGVPKVTMHFHRDLLAVTDTFARHILRLTEDDICAGSPPLAFTFGLGGLVLFPLRYGASSLLIENPSPAALASAIEEHGVTVLYTAPTGYRTMLKNGQGAVLGRLRIGVSAGEHLSAETFAAVEAESGLRLVNGIGATEMLHVFISAAGDDIRPGATGRPIPGYRAIILGDDGKELPAGQVGRLAVIGPTGCRYLNDPRQADYVQGGWNVTGDTYVRDEDGYFFYEARSDSMIVAAGYNIGAPEVEAVIDVHPDVVESAVVARPDAEKGSIVNAFVVLRAGVAGDDESRESIQQFVRERLAPYKIPRRIDFLEKLPRNPSGKLQHFILREQIAAEIAASAEARKEHDA